MFEIMGPDEAVELIELPEQSEEETEIPAE